LFRFYTEQKILDIAGVKVGGQPGELPTVLVGSIFYDKHKIVTDHLRGQFDRKSAEAVLNDTCCMVEKTGNPIIIDIVGSSAQALIRYIDFVSSILTSPFLVDGPTTDARLPAIQHAVEVGLRDRAIYNSIDCNIRENEVMALKDAEVESAVLLAHNPRNVWPEGRIEILHGFEDQVGLLKVAEEAGVKKTLIDVAVLDVPSVGLAMKAIHLVKEDTGLPTGCGPSNATSTWKSLKKGKLGGDAAIACEATANAVTIPMGANFVLYGPIENTGRVFPAIALTDALVAYHARRLGIRIKAKNHPLFKIFP